MLRKFIFDDKLSIYGRDTYTLEIEISRVQVLSFIAIVTTLLNETDVDPIPASMRSKNYDDIEILVPRSHAAAFLGYLKQMVDAGEITLRGYRYDDLPAEEVAKLLS